MKSPTLHIKTMFFLALEILMIQITLLIIKYYLYKCKYTCNMPCENSALEYFKYCIKIEIISQMYAHGVSYNKNVITDKEGSRFVFVFWFLFLLFTFCFYPDLLQIKLWIVFTYLLFSLPPSLVIESPLWHNCWRMKIISTAWNLVECVFQEINWSKTSYFCKWNGFC